MIVDAQFSSAHNDWPRLRDAVQQAEAEGYDTTWVYDHFDGSLLGGDRPLLECFTLLGAMAAATTRIGVGAMVVNVANRHRALLSAAASSVQRISDGRLRLGIGAGAGPESPWAGEHHERGIPLRASIEERHADVAHAIAELRTVEPIPVIVGVNSVALAQLAGRVADGVNVRLRSAAAPRLVAAAREAAGDRPFEVSGWCHHHDEAGRELAEQLGLDRLVLCWLQQLDRR